MSALASLNPDVWVQGLGFESRVLLDPTPLHVLVNLKLSALWTPRKASIHIHYPGESRVLMTKARRNTIPKESP